MSARDRFDPLAGKVAPHLTLVSPFEDPMSDEALESHVREAVANISAFAGRLQSVTLHEGEYLFLNVKRGSDALIHLRNNLYAGRLGPHCDRRYTFIPHVTIGRLSREQVREALDATAELTREIDFLVDAVSVYRIGADGLRPVLFEIRLK
jgi:2'-5' RNA ligase